MRIHTCSKHNYTGTMECPDCFPYFSVYLKETILEFTKIFINGLESKSLYPADIYTVKYKRKKYTGTIEEIFDKWIEDVL